MRARPPDTTGYIHRDGVRIYYETYGSGPATILVLPTWSVLDSSHGRFQLVDLSRRYRVVTFDGRGSGKSDRPVGRAAYAGEEFVQDAIAVLDATGTDQAVVVACSLATHWMLRLAADHPDRVLGAVASGTNLPLAPGHHRPEVGPFLERPRSEHGWAKFNAEYWRTHYEDFLRFFFSQVWTEPHSASLIETCVATGLGTTAETLIDTVGADQMSEDEAKELLHRTECPWLVIHGEGDELQPPARAERLAEEVGATLVMLSGAGHCSGNRDPVRFNLLIREFTEEILGWRARRRIWTRAPSRPRTVLMVPGDGGPDTVMRDLRVASAMRERRPELRIEWLADAPARVILAEHGEVIHPASADLPSEEGDLDQKPGLQPTDAFSAWRVGDEARFLTFMILHDLVAEEPVDLVVADRAWGIDHYLHENPELKRFAFAWLTDAIGWLPEPDADDRRRHLMVDANAEMIEQVERYPHIRDDAIYFGNLDDLSGQSLGAELPNARDWASDRFAFVGASGPTMAEEAADRVAARLVQLL